jgi:hypothetical protein
MANDLSDDETRAVERLGASLPAVGFATMTEPVADAVGELLVLREWKRSAGELLTECLDAVRQGAAVSDAEEYPRIAADLHSLARRVRSFIGAPGGPEG